MIAIDRLAVVLHELSDEDFQRRAWLASAGPVVSSFEELVCQAFDDTGLAIALDRGTRPAELTEESYRLLTELDSAAQKIDPSLPPQEILQSTQMMKVRVLARRALESLESTEQTGAGSLPDGP